LPAEAIASWAWLESQLGEAKRRAGQRACLGRVAGLGFLVTGECNVDEFVGA